MIYILKNEQIGNDIVVPVFTTSGSSIGQTYSLPLIHQAAERQADIAQRLGISHQTVNIARRAFLSTENLVMFLQRKPRQTPPVPAKITGEQEAQIIALACSPAPKGYARWTLRLLAAQCVQLHYSDTMSPMTISTLLRKCSLSLT